MIDGLMRRAFSPRIPRRALVLCALVTCAPVFFGTQAFAIEGGGGPAGEAPSIDGESVVGITEHGATLGAKINPNGLETTYEFWLDYAVCQKPEGVNCDLWSSESVGHGTISAGNEDQTVGVDLTSLKPGYSYTYRVLATSSAGTTRGQPHAFKTLQEGTAPKTAETAETSLPSTSVANQPSPAGGEGLLAVSQPLLSPTLATVDISSSHVRMITRSRSTTNALRLAKALRACKKRPKRQRTACRKQAHRKYATTAKEMGRTAG
jgi:hypothetical protein